MQTANTLSIPFLNMSGDVGYQVDNLGPFSSFLQCKLLICYPSHFLSAFEDDSGVIIGHNCVLQKPGLFICWYFVCKPLQWYFHILSLCGCDTDWRHFTVVLWQRRQGIHIGIVFSKHHDKLICAIFSFYIKSIHWHGNILQNNLMLQILKACLLHISHPLKPKYYIANFKELFPSFLRFLTAVTWLEIGDSNSHSKEFVWNI